jgi:hypothetical protein
MDVGALSNMKKYKGKATKAEIAKYQSGCGSMNFLAIQM